jgi:hypothetical protein
VAHPRAVEPCDPLHVLFCHRGSPDGECLPVRFSSAQPHPCCVLRPPQALFFTRAHARLHKIIVRRLAAYFNTTFVFLSGYLPPIMGMSDGPHHVPMSAKHAEQVRMLILASLICTGVLQL